MAVDRDYVPKGLGAGPVGRLCRELQAAGVRLLLNRCSDGSVAGPVTRAVDAGAVTESRSSAEQLRQQIYDVLVAGLPLSLSIRELGSGNDARTALVSVCDMLREAVQIAGVPPNRLVLVVDGGALSPREAYLIRHSRLGDGPIRMIPHSSLMSPGFPPHDQAGDFWGELWRARRCGDVRIAYGMHVMSPCRLLSAERASAVLPVCEIQAPPGTAWLPMTLNVCDFANDRGDISEAAIERALRHSVDIADTLHDQVLWSTARMRHDAWLNRRLAFVLGGFGDLLRRRRLAPGRFENLKELGELLRWIKEVMHAQSRAIARRTSYLPALELGDPSRMMPGGTARCDWRDKWREAVGAVAIRHRNLLVLAPWSVFPADGAADYRFADLLPLLRHADTCSLAATPALLLWNARKFSGFHRRAWAALQQRDAMYQIAEPA